MVAGHGRGAAHRGGQGRPQRTSECSHRTNEWSQGMDVVQLIEAVKTDRNDKPWEDIKIVNVTIA